MVFQIEVLANGMNQIQEFAKFRKLLIIWEYLLKNCWNRSVRRMDLSKVKTSELVAELKTREGVEMVIADPYQKGEVSVEGPAVILIVMD